MKFPDYKFNNFVFKFKEFQLPRTVTPGTFREVLFSRYRQHSPSPDIELEEASRNGISKEQQFDSNGDLRVGIQYAHHSANPFLILNTIKITLKYYFTRNPVSSPHPNVETNEFSERIIAHVHGGWLLERFF